MANKSQYKNMELPISTERYSIDVFNKNYQIIDTELHNLEVKNQEQDNNSSSIQNDLNNHKNNKENPHQIKASQLGLEKVENKSSEDIRNELTRENVTTALGYKPYTPDEVDDKLSVYDDANDKKHTHENKKVLDEITPELIDKWNESSNSGGAVESVNGQTGQVNITPANIGAVSKSGDTMTGQLNAPSIGGNAMIGDKESLMANTTKNKAVDATVVKEIALNAWVKLGSFTGTGKNLKIPSTAKEALIVGECRTSRFSIRLDSPELDVSSLTILQAGGAGSAAASGEMLQIYYSENRNLSLYRWFNFASSSTDRSNETTVTVWYR